MSPATAHGPANGRTGAERPMVEAHHVRKSFGRLEVLKGIPNIGIVKLSHRDVVRHELVQAIVKAYEKYTARNNDRRGNPNR